MYLTRGKLGTYYSRSGEQRHGKAPFLILMVHYKPIAGKILGKRSSIRAVIRDVALHQTGHFMMGSARIGSKRYVISGAYGDMGLPMEVAEQDWKRGVPMPKKLEEAFWQGGGHNAPGKEGPAIYEWGHELLEKGLGRGKK
jgi:hypothetical protein